VAAAGGVAAVAAAGAEATGAGATATGCGVVDGDKEKLRSAPTCINRLRLCVSKRGLRNRPLLNAPSDAGLVLVVKPSAFALLLYVAYPFASARVSLYCRTRSDDAAQGFRSFHAIGHEIFGNVRFNGLS
jgi:hypothetical protein